TGLFVDHLLSQPMTRMGVDLVEMSSFRLGGSRKERDRTSHERELERALPIGTRRHLILRDRRNFNRTENFQFRQDPSEAPHGQKATGEIPRQARFFQNGRTQRERQGQALNEAPLRYSEA